MKNRGFTLVELLVTVGLFAIVTIGITSVFKEIIEIARATRIRSLAINVANEVFEFGRLLPYDNVGVIGGIPNGDIPESQILVREGYQFLVETVVENMDDEFDGTLLGSPSDANPADFKLIETTVTCSGCDYDVPIVFTARIAPKSLEEQGSNGSLLIYSLNAEGFPLPGADVRIVNTTTDPAIDVTETTDENGQLLIIGAPPADQSYEVTVSKDGYTTDMTYLPSDPSGLGYAQAVHPHETVVPEQLSEATFLIDLESSLEVDTKEASCAIAPNVDYTLTGSRLIGYDPDVPLVSDDVSTSASGSYSHDALPWDTYFLTITDSVYELVGLTQQDVVLNPGEAGEITAVVSQVAPRRLVVAVTDQQADTPVNGAQLLLTGPSNYSSTETSGSGSTTQVTWSGGSGQTDFVDPTKYFSGSNININSFGDIRLQPISGNRYQASGNLTSSTFDFGVGVNYDRIKWLPVSQPSQTGSNSVKFQIATNTDNATWNFVGPDGTNTTYFTTSNQIIPASHDGNRYFRYKAFLSTTNNRHTPTVSSVSIVYGAECSPPGYANFSGLGSGTYTLTVSNTGYSNYVTTIDMSSNWISIEVPLQPS